MIRYQNYYIVLLLGVLALSACKSSSNDDNIVAEKSEYQKCNEWIAGVMRSDYLWKSSIPADNKLDYTASPETFFYTLLSSNDGKHTSSKNYFYSYIEKNKDYTSSKAISDDTDSYGIDFVRYSLSNKAGYEYDRVMYVLPGSPAEKAGLVRGDFITKIDGSDINMSAADYKKLLQGAARSLTVLHKVSDKTMATISLPASTAVNSNPIFYSTVIEKNGKKIGYLVYNQFVSGPHDDYKDHTYDNELIALFNGKFKGVDEFILDLRYNPGGLLTSSRLLSRLLVPQSAMSNVFCTLTDAAGHKTSYIFNEADKTFTLNGFTSLNLSRLYVIATESTASASEAAINGLAPYMKVIKIGLTTEGKNVGSVNYDGDDKYAWDIQPITFSITSSAGNVYNNGLAPDYEKNELKTDENAELLPFGNESEYLLSTALSLITTGTASNKVLSSKAQTSSATAVQLVPIENVSPVRTKGLIKTTD